LSQSATACLDGDSRLWSALSSCDVPASVAVMDLLGHFAKVGDPRRVRWVDHPVSVVLALCAGAVVAGMRSFTAIAGWVTDTPADLLMSIYARRGRVSDGDVVVPLPPSKATIWRVLTEVDAASVDAAVGAWLWERGDQGERAESSATTEPVNTTTTDSDTDSGSGSGADLVRPVLLAVDGKTVRGAVDAEGNQTHLLATMTHHQGLVIAQTEVDGKTNEIPMLPTLLDQIDDLAEVVVTADALHTQRATARYLHDRGAEFVFCVKENQPKLFAALNALPWNDVPVSHTQTDRGHGRITTRTMQVLPAPDDLPFPHVHQAFLLERYVTDVAGTATSAIAVLGITSQTTNQAGAPSLADAVRGHWGIESLHWLRDTLYREDDSTVRTRSGPRVMAALRNLAIGALHLAGRTDITEATRWASRRPNRPFTILELN
jgi:predicted transposase YbfD/YdcC